MTGRPEVERHRQKLDATFERALSIRDDTELLSDFARLLCVLVAGFLEQAVIEFVVEYARAHSDLSVQRYVEYRVRQFTNANTQRIIELLGAFDSAWRTHLESYFIDEHKDAVNSVVDLRHAIAHGQFVGITMVRIKDYYGHVKHVVDHIAGLCFPN
jgi:hypothetical protein